MHYQLMKLNEEDYRKNIMMGIKPTDVTLTELFSIPVVIVNMERKFTENEMQLFSEIPMEKVIEQGMFNHQSIEHYLFKKFAEELKEIRNFCEYQIERYLQKIEGVDTDLATLRITQSWLNKTEPQEHHHPHIHPNSYLSAVLYIKCLPRDMIVFENRLHGIFNTFQFPNKGDKLTQWTAREAAVKVKEGDLIIFPSWIIHHVNKNETTNERISLSFNTFPIGEMGKISSATHLKL